jgi:N-acetylglucosaminyldiphosphoundecaprenol N-acetyl-beta-D-mannosaminyltransferase
MLSVCAALAREGISAGFFGASRHVLAACVERVKRRFPSLRVAFQSAPPFRALSIEENQAYLDRIQQSGCRVLFVGLGCPKQERWMAENAGAVPVVMVGVGAAFDFLAGQKKQAPGWIQRLGLEWVFRLLHEPRRLFRRYVYHNPRFAVLALLQWFKAGLHGRDME